MTAKEQQERAQAVKAMIETTGWGIVEADLLSEVTSNMRELLKTDNLEQLRTLQIEVRSMQRLLNKIKSYADID